MTCKAIASAVLAAGLLWSSTVLSSGRFGEDYFTNSAVITQDGDTVEFYDDLIRDKIVLISFIFTTCKDLCPINTARLALVAEKLKERMGDDIFFVSISVDPENDTPERLKSFARSFYDGPGWTFITGDPATLKAIGDKLGNRGERPSDHRNEVILGNDETGEWARNTPFGEIDSLAFAILDMDPAWRARIRAPEATYLTQDSYSHLRISPQPGQALFKKLCAPCHTVGVGDRAGPDLLGVTERRDRGWLVRFIREPENMRKANDPQTLELLEQFPGARMPSFGLSDNDAADLITFLEARSAEVSAARMDAIAHDNQSGHHHGESGRPTSPAAAPGGHGHHSTGQGEVHEH